MELYIFDRDSNFKGIIDMFISIRYVKRYYELGEFKLHCSLTSEALILLERENIIYIKGDVEACYIEHTN